MYLLKKRKHNKIIRNTNMEKIPQFSNRNLYLDFLSYKAKIGNNTQTF